LTTSGQLLSIVTGNESGTPLPISGPDGTPAFSSVDGIVSSNGGSNTYILPYNGGGSFVAIGGQNKDYGNYIQFSGSTGFSSADVDLLSAPPLRLFHLDSPPAAPVTPTITIGQNSINGVNVTFQGSGNGSSPIDGFYYSADGTDIDRSIIGPYHSGDTADQALNHPTVKFLPVGSGNSAQLTDIPNGVTIKMASRIIGAALSPMVSQLVRVACQPISCPVTQFAFLEFPDITLECPTVGSTILYSINEIDPDSPPAYIYEGSFKPIKRNLYLRAVARKTGYGDSPLFSRNFILALPTPIVVTRDKGEWLICEVFMSGNIECKFFYTLDGSQPKPFQSDFQEREFLLKSDTIVSAIGYREGCIPTNVTQLTIPISSPRKMKMKFMKDILF
jgi:hypothetical protein